MFILSSHQTSFKAGICLLPLPLSPSAADFQALYHTDLALACVFTLNWVFWFWIAEDRLRYIFSFLTLVDVVTITPSFVLYGLGATVAETVPGLNFLRVLR
jgi:hypothetical protein